MMYHHHDRIPRDPYYEYQRPYSMTSSSSSSSSSNSPTCRPCPICQAPPTSFHADITSGDVICTNCGAVLDEKLCDESAEWRDYSNNPNNESDAGVGRKRARCGDAIVDEMKYIGGIMPTKVSSTCFPGGGGGTAAGREGGGEDKLKLATIRQRLKRTHNIIENRIAQEQKARYAEIILDRQAREAKLRRGETEEENTAGIVVDGGDYEGLMMRQQCQEESLIPRTLAQMTASTPASDEHDHEERAYTSLQNPKWSLSDALLLYGTLEQVQHHLLPSQSSLISSCSDNDDGGGWTQLQLDNERLECKKRIDAATRTSLHRLYIAYKLLEGAARALDLFGKGVGAGGGSSSKATFRQAVATLIKFAIKNDGVRVRGISSGGLSSLSTLSLGDGDDAASNTALTLSLFGSEEMAWSALFDANSATTCTSSTSARSSSKTTSPSTVLHRLRQYASLGSAILYLAAKSTGVGRTLTEVCSAFGTYAVVHPSNRGGNNNDRDGGEVVPGEPLVRPKYCSRAMQELRAALPEVVSSLPQVKNDSMIIQPTPSSQPASEMTSTQGRAPIKVECTPEIPSNSIIDRVGIASNPMVTADEAALVDLTTRMANSLGLPSMAIQAAAMIAIQCARDAPNLTRAQHRNKSSSRRCIDKAHIRPSRRSREKAAGGCLEESPDVIAISSILLVCVAGGTMKRLASQTVGNSAAAAAASSSFGVEESSEDLNDDFLTLHEESDYSRRPEATSPVNKAEGTETGSVHRTNTVSWVAWNDQPPWHRDISQLEQCAGISRKIILSFYSNFIHPRRLFLLDAMSKLEHGFGTLTSSSLLHNIVVAAPLMSLRNIG